MHRAQGDTFDPQEPESQVTVRYTAEGSHLKSDMVLTIFTLASEVRPHNTEINDDSDYLGFGASVYLAIGSGELKLASRDPTVQPSLDFRLLAEPFDRERMRKGIRTVARLAEHPAFQDLLLERVAPTDEELASDEALDSWLMKYAGSAMHVSGTCKMGPASDSMAVVDQYGNVHGLQDLRVIDASVMPNVIRANTNATTIMIAEKMADLIKEGK